MENKQSNHLWPRRLNNLNRCQDLENIIIAGNHPDFATVDGVMFDKQRSV